MKLITQNKIKTPEGEMIPIFKDWENEGYEPKMVYLTTMTPGTTKGPILHKERKYFVSAISGTIDIEFLFEGKIKTVNLHDEANPTVYNTLILEEHVPVRFISRGIEIGTIVNCPSKAWHPDNPDTFKYSSWEEYLNGKE